MKTDTNGALCIVLHAHLPYVRHTDDPHALELRWLFEAITETYLPLLDIFTRLTDQKIPFNITMSLTPPLAAMLSDPLLQQRYETHLEKLIELSHHEIQRTTHDVRFHDLATAYNQRYRAALQMYRDRYKKNITAAFVDLARTGVIELIGSCATHGFLPILNVNRTSVEAQVNIGTDFCSNIFGSRPSGFWLPECGYYEGLDPVLRQAGIRYTFLDSHGVRNGDPQPVHDVYAPVITPGGLIVFPRDPHSSREIWSSTDGYPGDPTYREYYKDIGYELELDYIRPYIHPEGIRVNTGIKYWRITGGNSVKAPYDIQTAQDTAQRHAHDFIEKKTRQFDSIASNMNKTPLITAPFDAELFGHWWYEGPQWLEAVLRGLTQPGCRISSMTPTQYLAMHPVCQISQPTDSTWGQNGYSEFWLNESNDWVCRAIHKAGSRMQQLAGTPGFSSAPAIADQAARELLLAEASDWPFILKSGTTVSYATRRIEEHLKRFNQLCDKLESGTESEPKGKPSEKTDPFMADIHCAEYYRPPVNTKQSERTGKNKSGTRSTGRKIRGK